MHAPNNLKQSLVSSIFTPYVSNVLFVACFLRFSLRTSLLLLVSETDRIESSEAVFVEYRPSGHTENNLSL